MKATRPMKDYPSKLEYTDGTPFVVERTESYPYLVGDKVLMVESPCDANRSKGKIGTISCIHPTARGDGSVWINYSINIRSGYGVSAKQEYLEAVK